MNDKGFNAIMKNAKFVMVDPLLMVDLYDIVNDDIKSAFCKYAKSPNNGFFKGKIGTNDVVIEWDNDNMFFSIDGIKVGTENYLNVIDSENKIIGVTDKEYIFIPIPDIYDITE